MPKKIKFALEMKDGVKVRTIEDLRDSFDIEKAISYFLDGKLLEWLQDRYYEPQIKAVQALDSNAPDFKQKLCAALGVEYQGEDVSLEEIEEVNAKRAKLKQLTSDEEIISHALDTAFSQEELGSLLDAGTETIYLCGKEFHIPLQVEHRHYVGVVGEPLIHIDTESMDELEKKDISFENVQLPEKLQKRRKCQPYHVSELFEPLLSAEDRVQAEKLYNVACDILGNITFDPAVAINTPKEQ